MKRALMVAVALTLLVQVSLQAAESYRVTVTLYPGEDAAAVAKRLAATYRGELERPVETAGDLFTMTIALGAQEAALLARDPHVEGVQQISTEAMPSVPLHPIEAHTTTNWTLGNYAYDGSGNIRKIGSDLFVYDGKSRLLRADAGAGHQQEYAYDGFGNLHTVLTDVPLTLERTTATLSPYRTRVAINPATNRAEYPGSETNQPNTVDPLTQQSYSMAALYDSRGNATALQIARADTFEYDVLDMARKASIGGNWRLYIYSASDERIGTIDLASQNGAEVTSDWTFRDMGGQVLRRMRRSSNGAWTWKEDYIYRGGQLLAAQVPDAVKVKHFHLDHLGTPRLITGNGGIEFSRHSYYAFGGEAGGSSSGEKQFTGHERDSASLDYMHARYYYPQIARFLSVDPARASVAPASPQTWNRYPYTRNNPINRVDRDGLADQRCEADQLITESENVLIMSSYLSQSTASMFEYGLIIGRNGSVSAPFTSRRPDFVDPSLGLDIRGSKAYLKNTNEVPVRTMHTHLPVGEYRIPGGTFTPTDPSRPSAADRTMATQTVPGYILIPSQKLLVRINTDGTYEVILSGKDYEQWQARANKARQDQLKEATPR